MRKSILEFPRQFEFAPVIVNTDKLRHSRHVVVCGMGGSHLAGDLLNPLQPGLDLRTWSDYGLPPIPADKLQDSLVIASSYSGNTEETLDAYRAAQERGLPLAAVAIGGKLLELAKKDGVPYVQMPDTGIQPRMALGFSLRALLALIGDQDGLRRTQELAHDPQAGAVESEGRDLAKWLKNYVPVIYAADPNRPLAYYWKITLNETGKIPAFYNVLPELNHNEMNGFDVKPSSRPLAQNFAFIFLSDTEDHPLVQKRMVILKSMYQDRKLPVRTVPLGGQTKYYKFFRNVLLAIWTAFYTAEQYGLEAEQVPMVEEFKKLVSGE